MTQLEKWAARGLVKLPAPKSSPPSSPEQAARCERKKAKHREWLARRRAAFKAAGLNWQGKPYTNSPPHHPPLTRREYLDRWKAKRLAAQETTTKQVNDHEH